MPKPWLWSFVDAEKHMHCMDTEKRGMGRSNRDEVAPKRRANFGFCSLRTLVALSFLVVANASTTTPPRLESSSHMAIKTKPQGSSPVKVPHPLDANTLVTDDSDLAAVAELPVAVSPVVVEVEAGAAASLKPLRICLLVEPSPLTYVSGYANRYQALLQYLYDYRHEQGDAVTLVTAEVVHANPPSHWSSGTVPVHYTSGMRLPHYPLMSLALDWKLKCARVIANMRPDLIHASSPGFMVLNGWLWSRIFGVPLVMSYHTHLPVYVRSYIRNKPLSRLAEWMVWKLIRLVHSFADLTLVTSPQILQEFVDHGVPRCQVWQKGIDTERFHPCFYSLSMRQRMTNGHVDDCLILYAGRLGTEKRLDELKKVLHNMPPNVRLCFVGTGPHEAKLKELFASSEGNDEADSRCVFLGQLTGEPLSQAFASADIFCMPSDSETLGFVVLESMASGVPVIGVKAGGVQDLINHGVTGYLVDVGDTDAFGRCVQQLQNDDELRRQMSLNGRREMERWTWTASMEKLRTQQYPMALQNFEQRFEQRLWRFLTMEEWRQRRKQHSSK